MSDPAVKAGGLPEMNRWASRFYLKTKLGVLALNNKAFLTPVERIKNLFNNGPMDRIPFVPFALGFTAGITGYTIGEIYTDPEKSFRAQMLSAELFHYDPLFPPFSSQFGAWEFGGEMRFPAEDGEQSPIVVKHPVSCAKDINHLHIPDLQTAGNVPGMIKFAQLSKEHGLPAVFHAGSPFTRVGDMTGATLMMRWLVKEPDLLHKLLQKVTDFLVNVGELFAAEFGAENVIAFNPAALETNQLISPRHFESYALPYLIELHERLINLGITKFWVHICGDQKRNIPYWDKVPMGKACLLSISEQIDLMEAIEVFGEKAMIAGNIPTTQILKGSPEEVYDAVAAAIFIGKKSPRGYVVMSGCELPPQTPPINVYYMAKAVKENGWLVRMP